MCISLSGVSILAPVKQGLEADISGVQNLCLRGVRLDTPARLLKVLEATDSGKYIIEMDTSDKIEELISRFIFQIQGEIIRELKEQCISSNVIACPNAP